MLGKRDQPEQPTDTARELLRLTAAVDQVLALVDEAMHTHQANRALVDLALDVQNTLRPGR